LAILANLREVGRQLSGRKCLVVGLGLSIAAAVRAADKDVEGLLAHMRNAYKSVKSATFTTESHFRGSVFVIEFLFKSPSKIRMDLGKQDFKSSLIKVSDGASISTKVQNTTTFTRQPYSIDNFERNLPANLETYCFWDYERQLSTKPGKNMEHSQFMILKNVGWNGKKWLVLEETAPVQNVVCRYYIDSKTYLIWRTLVRQIGADRDSQDCQITKMDTSATVSDANFKLPAR